MLAPGVKPTAEATLARAVLWNLGYMLSCPAKEQNRDTPAREWEEFSFPLIQFSSFVVAVLGLELTMYPWLSWNRNLPASTSFSQIYSMARTHTHTQIFKDIK